MEQVFNRYGFGPTREFEEEIRERLIYVELIVDDKVINCGGSKLLGQRTQIENRIWFYFYSGLPDSRNRSSLSGRFSCST